MKYLIAYPDALRLHDTIEDARALADAVREIRHVKIYELREVEHWCPTGPKDAPRDPGPPGTPTEAAIEKAA